MFVLEFCPLDSSERQELTRLCQHFLQASENDRKVAQETLLALCALTRTPPSFQETLTPEHIWHLKRLVWNYSTAPQMLLSETIWFVQRLQ